MNAGACCHIHLCCTTFMYSWRKLCKIVINVITIPPPIYLVRVSARKYIVSEVLHLVLLSLLVLNDSHLYIQGCTLVQVFSCWSVHVGFVVNRVTLEQVSLGELQFSLVFIIPPMHNLHAFVCHQYFFIISTDSVNHTKETLSGIIKM